MEVSVILGLVAMVIVGTSGILGNAAILKTAFVTSKLKTSFAGLLLLVLVCDMGGLVLALGQQVLTGLGSHPVYITTLTIPIHCTNTIALTAGTALALDRCLAVKGMRYFKTWNSTRSRTSVCLIVILASCGATPLPSYIATVTGCPTDNRVSIDEVLSYLICLMLVTLTIVFTCYFSRWTVKLETRVADVGEPPLDHTTPDLRTIIRSCKCVRWMLLHGVSSYVFLITITLAVVAQRRSCSLHVSSTWWFTMVRAILTSLKPFIVILVNRQFRKCVISCCFRYSENDQLNSIFCNPCDGAQSSHAPNVTNVPRTTNTDMQPHHNIDVISNFIPIVATIQGRPYPFPRPEIKEPCLEQITAPASGSSYSPTVDLKKTTCPPSMHSPTLSLSFDNPPASPSQNKAQPRFSVNEPSQTTQQSGDGQISVNISFQLVMDKRHNSCPDLHESDTCDKPDDDRVTHHVRERANTFCARPKDTMFRLANRNNEPLTRLVQNGHLHPGDFTSQLGLNTKSSVARSLESLSGDPSPSEARPEIRERARTFSACQNISRPPPNRLPPLKPSESSASMGRKMSSCIVLVQSFDSPKRRVTFPLNKSSPQSNSFDTAENDNKNELCKESPEHSNDLSSRERIRKSSTAHQEAEEQSVSQQIHVREKRNTLSDMHLMGLNEIKENITAVAETARRRLSRSRKYSAHTHNVTPCSQRMRRIRHASDSGKSAAFSPLAGTSNGSIPDVKVAFATPPRSGSYEQDLPEKSASPSDAEDEEPVVFYALKDLTCVASVTSIPACEQELIEPERTAKQDDLLSDTTTLEGDDETFVYDIRSEVYLGSIKQ